MKTHTMNLSIVKGVIQQDVSKGITLSLSKGDVRPNLRFNNLKISPLVHLLFKNNKENNDADNDVHSTSFEQKKDIVIDDISLVLTEQQEIMFDDPLEKDSENNLLYGSLPFSVGS